MSDAPFNSTSQLAGQQAALKSGQWRQRILECLDVQASTLFEVAAHFGVPDHTISGRFSELAADGYIEHAGERRNKPETNCACEVWRRRRATGIEPHLVDQLGYPLSLRIDDDIYDRQELLPSEGFPGFPYSRRADTGGARLLVRVEIIECPGCGKPLYYIEENGRKKFRCGNVARCGITWVCRMVSESGKGPMLAMVMETADSARQRAG